MSCGFSQKCFKHFSCEQLENWEYLRETTRLKHKPNLYTNNLSLFNKTFIYSTFIIMIIHTKANTKIL